MTNRRLPALLVLLIAVGCQDQTGPTDPHDLTPRDALPAFLDGTKSGGNPNFLWLPPLVKEPAVTGPANLKLKPVVRVCADASAPALDAVPCASGDHVVEFVTGGAGPGASVEVKGEQYQVNWDTKATDLELGKTYRVWVLIGNLAVGFADVLIAQNGNEAKKSDGETFGLVDGRTLPLRFRLQVGVTAGGLPDTVDVDCSQVDCAEFTVADEPFDECTDGGLACLSADAQWLPEEFAGEDVTILAYQVERDPETGQCFGGLGLAQWGGCYSIATFPDLVGATFKEDANVIWAMCQEPGIPAGYVLHQRSGSEIRIPQTVPGVEPPAGRFCPGAQIGMGRLFEWTRPFRDFLFGSPLYAADGLAGRLTSFSDFFYAPELAISAVATPPAGPHPPSTILGLRFQVVSDHQEQAVEPVPGVEVGFLAPAGTSASPGAAVSDAGGFVETDFQIGASPGGYGLIAALPVGADTFAASVQEVAVEPPSGFQSFEVELVDDATVQAAAVGPEGIAANPFVRVSFYVVDPVSQAPRFLTSTATFTIQDVPGFGRIFRWTATIEDQDGLEVFAVGDDGSEGLYQAVAPPGEPIENSLVLVESSLAPQSPATLEFEQAVTFTIEYGTDSPNGVFIWAQPRTDGQLTPGQSFSGSLVNPPGSGTVEGRLFRINSGDPPVVVDEIWVHMWSVNDAGGQGDLLLEIFVPVSYTYEDAP